MNYYLSKLSEINLLHTLRLSRWSNHVGGPWLNILVYRRCRVGLGRNVVIVNHGHLQFGLTWPHCGYEDSLLMLDDNARLEIKGGFVIYTGSSVHVNRQAQLELGSGYVNNRSRILCFQEIRIGDDVAIAEEVVIRDSDNHSILEATRPASAPIHIGNHVWIGMRAMILKGVTVGDGSVIAAGAVVTRDVPAHSLAAGIPARVIKTQITWK